MSANFISTMKLEIMIRVNVMQTMVVEVVRWLKLRWNWMEPFPNANGV